MKLEQIKAIIEALLFSHQQVMSVAKIAQAFEETQRPDNETLRAVLEELAQEYEGRAIQLREVAGGYRFQTRAEYAPWVTRLLAEKPSRYSRATLETLALIIYRQPITRAEIEDIRGVAVSSSIIKTLEERGWIRVVGHREVPGRPALFASTRQFLEDFDLQRLSDLPSLESILAMEEVEAKIAQQLELEPDATQDATTDKAHVELTATDASQTDLDQMSSSEQSTTTTGPSELSTEQAESSIEQQETSTTEVNISASETLTTTACSDNIVSLKTLLADKNKLRSEQPSKIISIADNSSAECPTNSSSNSEEQREPSTES